MTAAELAARWKSISTPTDTEVMRQWAEDAMNAVAFAEQREAALRQENARLTGELKAERDWLADDGPLHEVKRLRQIERDWGQKAGELLVARAEIATLEEVIRRGRRRSFLEELAEEPK